MKNKDAKSILNQRTGALYIRVSTDKQEELSPDSQISLGLEYAKKNNIYVPKEFIFRDDGISGRSAKKRPDFQRMIGIAKSKDHPIDVILVWKFSRFARNQEESIVYKSMLKKDHVDVISISEPLIDGPFGSLIERIIEWMDEYYSIRLSGEVYRGMTENALRGKYQARPPLGYKVMHAKEPPVIVPQEASIVKLIYDMYTEQGMGMFGIAKKLNELGYKTSHGKKFERRSIDYILTNETYTGKSVWNRHDNVTKEMKDKSEWIISDGMHEAIISEEQFRKAQQRLDAEYIPHACKPPEVSRHWLSGVVKCHACGRSLSTSVHKDKRYGRIYTNFQCYGYLKGKCTSNHQISEKKLAPEVLRGLNDILEGTAPLEFKVIHAQDTAEQSAAEIIQNRLSDIEKKEERIKQAYREGIDTIEEYKENKRILAEERKELQGHLASLTVEVPDKTDSNALMLSRLRNVYDIITNENIPMIERNAAIKTIVNKIVYDSDSGEISIYLYCSEAL